MKVLVDNERKEGPLLVALDAVIRGSEEAEATLHLVCHMSCHALAKCTSAVSVRFQNG
jgi:hypothetical protein